MPARYLRHGAQPEEEPSIMDMPQLEPFWAAGFSFSRGHFKLRVPYDAYQPMVFQVLNVEVYFLIHYFCNSQSFSSLCHKFTTVLPICVTNLMFQGEEIAIGIRGFTYGYDFYAPRDSIVFHEYASKSKRRSKVHMFWYVLSLSPPPRY
jgi:hypothetical protein